MTISHPYPKEELRCRLVDSNSLPQLWLRAGGKTERVFEGLLHSLGSTFYTTSSVLVIRR